MFRIKQMPKPGTRDLPTYYSTTSGKANWTQFKDLAIEMSEAKVAQMLPLLNRGGLARALEVEPV